MNSFVPAIGWIWLSSLGRPNQEIRNYLLDTFGSLQAIWEASISQHLPDFMKNKAALSARFTDGSLRERAIHIYERAISVDMGICTPDHPHYPSVFADLYGMPCVLYFYGRMPFETNPSMRLLSVVGSRQCTAYGMGIAEWFGGSLATQGIGIVSGMARGIDGMAHKGALHAGGYTLAVLAGGIDVVYPKEHQYLYEQIRNRGCILSEHPPGTPPDRRFFPARNRIIAGISEGTLVVEARKESGAMITVSRAIEYNKNVYAIPGNIRVPTSMGCNDLIRQGGICVTCPEDILEDMGLKCGRASCKLPTNLSETERNILYAIEAGGVFPETISIQLGLPLGGIYTGLMLLEMKKLVGKNPSGAYYVKKFHFTE